MRRPISVLCAMLLPLSAPAQTLTGCDRPEANAQFLKYPHDTATRSFAQGAISMIELDTYGEPTCCSAHLMIVLESASEPFPICTMLSNSGPSGYLSTDLAGAEAVYDPARGLVVTLPVRTYGDTGGIPGQVVITVNQATGAVTAE